MSFSVTRISAKGRVVIPIEIRKELSLEKGTLLLAYATDDRAVLKKLSEPEPEISPKLLEPIRMKAKELGITREDVKKAIREVRKNSE